MKYESIEKFENADAFGIGAKADTWFSHIAVECPGEECSNEWCEEVTDEQYGKL